MAMGNVDNVREEKKTINCWSLVCGNYLCTVGGN